MALGTRKPLPLSTQPSLIDLVVVSSVRVERKSKCVLLFIGNLFIFEMAKPVAGEIVELETKVKLKFGCNAGCLMRK